MDEHAYSSRRFRPPRPESSASGHSRMTPRTASTNSSTVNLPSRSENTNARRDSGGAGASLLQERIRERKVESARRRSKMHEEAMALREAQSSPVRGTHGKDEPRPNSSGTGGSSSSKKGMGVKQMEEQVSTLHKQNFDLKLELYHRRQRQETLESRLDALEKDLAAQTEVNDELVAELEKRDQAVEEAVSIICDLEEEVKQLKHEREIARSLGQQQIGYFSFKGVDIFPKDTATPPEQSKPEPGVRPARTLARMPSFLSDKSEGAEALRSYLTQPNYRSVSDSTLPKLAEDGATIADGYNSPRLSVLSESSFLSVYGDKRAAAAIDDGDEDELPRQSLDRKSASVEEWIQSSPPVSATPRASQGPAAIPKSHYDIVLPSIETTSPLQRFDRLRKKLEQSQDLTAAAIHSQLRGTVNSNSSERSRSARVASAEYPRLYTMDHKGAFEFARGLPPTPDTAHSSMLRHRENSNDSYTQDRAIQGHIVTFPNSKDRHEALQSALIARPRSAGETIISRRDGWDDEIHEEYTDTASIAGRLNNEPGSLHRPYTRRAITPDLFTMNGDWSREMFNREPASPKLPPHPRQPRHLAIERSSSMEPRSDDTVLASTKSNPKGHYRNYYEEAENQYNNLNKSPRFEPPDRRSSLTATTKLRKTSISGAPMLSSPTAIASSPVSTPRDTKTFSLKHRILGRMGSEPPQASPQQQQLAPPNNNGGSGSSQLRNERRENEARRSQSVVQSDGGSARATPPPTKRSRGNTLAGAAPPVSPGGKGNDKEKGLRGLVSTFGTDGASDAKAGNRKRTGSIDVGGHVSPANAEDDEIAGTGIVKVSGAKRWFGRMGSIRR